MLRCPCTNLHCRPSSDLKRIYEGLVLYLGIDPDTPSTDCYGSEVGIEEAVKGRRWLKRPLDRESHDTCQQNQHHNSSQCHFCIRIAQGKTFSNSEFQTPMAKSQIRVSLHKGKKAERSSACSWSNCIISFSPRSSYRLRIFPIHTNELTTTALAASNALLTRSLRLGLGGGGEGGGDGNEGVDSTYSCSELSW
ncbi:hypothetical protein K504DRAFT_310457 [Pleomassaria siparia CBS 279.74]|uniref:Uncharacterized protein n=1 Tax=Pleomassaria siparia CBS 279.74 TaxID=1314801 RepID=A0A6G1K6S6_9PLEO|nr:hypothetical protein K504DRAFT_310457 [Pleomassaria siparia CBS 279.74]